MKFHIKYRVHVSNTSKVDLDYILKEEIEVAEDHEDDHAHRVAKRISDGFFGWKVTYTIRKGRTKKAP